MDTMRVMQRQRAEPNLVIYNSALRLSGWVGGTPNLGGVKLIFWWPKGRLRNLEALGICPKRDQVVTNHYTKITKMKGKEQFKQFKGQHHQVRFPGRPWARHGEMPWSWSRPSPPRRSSAMWWPWERCCGASRWRNLGSGLDWLRLGDTVSQRIWT